MIEFWEKSISYFTDMGVSREIAETYIIVSILLVIMAIAALVMRIIVIVKYQEGNHMSTSSGKSSCQIAREALDKAGLEYVQVKKAGFWRAFFIGNCYSITQKTIFLRRGIYNNNSITSTGLALQKVGIAKMCENKSKLAKTRNYAQFFSLFPPIIFIPVVVLGFVIDLLLFNTVGIFSIIGICIGLALVASGFVATLLSLPVEKKANDMAMQLIKETNLLNEEETRVIEKIFQAYLIAYICEFIIAILRIAQIILEIVINNQISKN